MEQLAPLVAELLNIEPAMVKALGKQPDRVRARSLCCYWAVRELAHPTTVLGQALGISQPAISQSMLRGEALAAEREWELSTPVKLYSYECSTALRKSEIFRSLPH